MDDDGKQLVLEVVRVVSWVSAERHQGVAASAGGGGPRGDRGETRADTSTLALTETAEHPAPASALSPVSVRACEVARVLLTPVVHLLRPDTDVEAALRALQADGEVHCTPTAVALAPDRVLPAPSGGEVVESVASAMNTLALERSPSDGPQDSQPTRALMRALLDTYPPVIAQLEAKSAEAGAAWLAVGVIRLTVFHQYAEARDALTTALAIQEAVHGPDAVEVGATLYRLALATGSGTGDYTSQQALAERALAILERALGPSHVEVAHALMAHAHHELGDARAQQAVLERALAILEARYGPNHVALAAPLTNLGHVHGVLGAPTTKKAYNERALVLLEQRYGPESEKLIGPLTGLGNAYGALDDPFTKRRMLERARTLCERAFGPNHVRLATILCNLADVCKSLEDYEQARTLALRALAIFQFHYGPEHVHVAAALVILGDVALNEGHLAIAHMLSERVLAIHEKFYGPDRPVLAGTLLRLAGVSIDLGDASAARGYLARCLAIEATISTPSAFHQRIVREARSLIARLDGGGAYSCEAQ